MTDEVRVPQEKQAGESTEQMDDQPVAESTDPTESGESMAVPSEATEGMEDEGGEADEGDDSGEESEQL